VTEPTLLVEKSAIPYTYSLKPVDAKKLREADAVFLVSRNLERFLDRPLRANHKARAAVVELAKADGMKLLPIRREGLWREAITENKSTKAIDPYLWLDPDNAALIVTTARDTLSRIDPANASQYAANATKVLEEIRQMDIELTDKLAPYSDVPYLLSRDNYQYFEKHYHLDSLGTVVLPGKKATESAELSILQETITRYNAVCLFASTTSSAGTLARITEVTGIGTGMLNAIGESSANNDAYFTLMHTISKELTRCFDQKRSLMS
jgi:zinc transport system substrate-binding protein